MSFIRSMTTIERAGFKEGLYSLKINAPTSRGEELANRFDDENFRNEFLTGFNLALQRERLLQARSHLDDRYKPQERE